jgi:hypothetical protein
MEYLIPTTIICSNTRPDHLITDFLISCAVDNVKKWRGVQDKLRKEFNKSGK